MTDSTRHVSFTGDVIYDIGANDGDDIGYYLKKARKVVAVEANPVLAKQIQSKFSAAVASGALVVESCVVTSEPSGSDVEFYVSTISDKLSQFGLPPVESRSLFDKVVLPARDIVSLVRQHGAPYYIKIDVEGCDADLLRSLFAADIRPSFVSAEVHDFDVFCVLVAIGGYRAFKLVDGKSVPEQYRDAAIDGLRGKETYSFREGAAGPFGNDILGPWYNTNAFGRLLGLEYVGWKDIHATSMYSPDDAACPRFGKYVGRAAIEAAKRLVRKGVASS